MERCSSARGARRRCSSRILLLLAARAQQTQRPRQESSVSTGRHSRAHPQHRPGRPSGPEPGHSRRPGPSPTRRSWEGWAGTSGSTPGLPPPPHGIDSLARTTRRTAVGAPPRLRCARPGLRCCAPAQTRRDRRPRARPTRLRDRPDGRTRCPCVSDCELQRGPEVASTPGTATPDRSGHAKLRGQERTGGPHAG